MCVLPADPRTKLLAEDVRSYSLVIVKGLTKVRLDRERVNI